jgi:anti-sigma B factor antagonist
VNINSKKILKEDKEFIVIQADNELFNLENQSGLKSFIEEHLNEGFNFYEINMQDVTAITSSGLGILISILNKIKKKDGILNLVNLPEKILKIFLITRLQLVFNIK